MQFLFVDESGTPPEPNRTKNTPFFVLGGVVIPEEAWPKLAADMRRIALGGYGVGGEIKWRHFVQRPDEEKHALSHLDAELRNELRADLFKALVSFRAIKVISVVVSTEHEYKKGVVKNAEGMYRHAYKQMTERFQYYLQDLSRMIGHTVRGIIVCDNRMPQGDDGLRLMHARLMGANDEMTTRYENIIEGLFIAPSHLSVGIQFADMVAGAVYRKYASKDDRFYAQIASAVRTSPQGKVEGYGIVKSPKGAW